MAEVRVENLTKRFGKVIATDNLTLTFRDKWLTVIVGPSGCGKTTLLRMISGLEIPTEGAVYIGGELVNDVPPWDRNLAMVFQSYALYPHMSVLHNLAFPLEAKKVPKDEIKRRVQQMAEFLHISELLHRKPRQLSGGEMQRVAVGRAIIRKPELFLMDEPLSNLDARLRVSMRAELKRLQKDLGVTTIYVTHDQAEAMTMADDLLVMQEGRIQQAGEPEEVYHHPKNIFVAGFIGSPSMNFMECRFDLGNNVLITQSFSYEAPAKVRETLGGKSVEDLILGVRAEDISVDPSPSPSAVPATVYITEPLGKETLLTLKTGNSLIKATVPPRVRPSVGEELWMRFEEGAIHLFDKRTEEALL